MTPALRHLVLAGLAACGGARTEAPALHGAAPPGSPGVEIAESLALGLVEGPSTARLTIVEAFDFACAHCTAIQGPIDELVREYGGKVRVVYKNFVLRPEKSQAAHLAACAAGKQGKFRAFADALRSELGKRELTSDEMEEALRSGNTDALMRSPLAEVDVVALARGLGLDVPAFETERKGERCRVLLDRDHGELEKLGVDHLPVFFINGAQLDLRDKDELRAAIDAGLAR